MKTSFWDRWCNSVRNTKPMGGNPLAHARRRALCLRELEDRVTPTLIPQMVLDVNPDTYSSNLSSLVAIGSTTFFTSANSLWKSDGTADGTVVVKDFSIGGMNTIPTYLTNVNGTLFFGGYTPSHGAELWKSDGTTAGTVLVKDIWTGTTTVPFGTFPNGSRPNNLMNVGGKLFFAADDGIHGRELWVSDGTEAGTVLVADMTEGGSSAIRDMTDVNGNLFFVAEERFLWTSDGTSAGTRFIKDFSTQSESVDFTTIFDLTSVNETLFFTAFGSWERGRELWKSDGTAAGTALVKDINPGTEWSDPYLLTEMNGTLYFRANDGAHGAELWKSDGTAAGTSMVKDVNPGSAHSYLSDLKNVDGTLYFAANGGTHGVELWNSNGTAAGTALLKDINPGASSSHPSQLTDVGGTLFLIADDGMHDREVWTSDGTAGGTVLVKDIYDGTLGYTPRQLTDMNGTLFFAAHDGTHGFEPWTSDGTPAGTALVKDVNAQGIGSNPRAMSDLNDSLFFVVGSAMWTSDGSAAGTVPFGVSHVNGSEMLDLNGMLYFSAWNSANNQHGLWKSDGTISGTALVSPLPDYSYARNLTDVNGTLFFTLFDVNGEELWKSDGTVTGTVMVKDIYPGNAPGYQGYWGYYPGGPYSSSPSSLTNVNGTLYFTAGDAIHGRQLWKSDGTEAGTVLFKDFSPGDVSYSDSLANVNGTLFISASDGTHGVELWKSDGTAAGTVLAADIVRGSASSFPTSLTSADGTLYFRANDGEHGAELWKSDGTAAGTVLVADINPGAGHSSPQSLTVIDGTLYFRADDGRHGAELWMSEGTAAATSLVGDINPGAASSHPFNLTAVDGTLFFSADDDVHGAELWTLVEQGMPSITIGDVTVTEGHAGTQSASFAVTLYFASELPVTVDYVTSDGSAIAGSDYQAASGTLTIPAGQTTGTITVLINGDRSGEPNETFRVTLSAPTNSTIADNVGAGVIVDDEPRISISDASVTEGNTGTRTAAFTVTLSAVYDQPVAVPYSTSNGDAAAGSDYQAAAGTLTIPAGQPSATITVLVNGDRLPEPNESFVLNLTAPTNATIVDGQGQGVITDDEPRVSISDVAKTEGRKNQTTLFTFTVTLSVAYDQAVTMSFRTVNGTATTGNSDYVSKTGTLTFNPGETTKTITIEVKGDSRKEANETFYVDLFGLSGNSLFTKNRGIGTILNDD